MIVAVLLLIVFYTIMILFTYASGHYSLGWSKPKAVVAAVFWFITGIIYFGSEFVKMMKKDKCEK